MFVWFTEHRPDEPRSPSDFTTQEAPKVYKKVQIEEFEKHSLKFCCAKLYIFYSLNKKQTIKMLTAMWNVPYFFLKMDKAQIWKPGAMILWPQEMDASEFSFLVFNVC